MNIGVGSNIYDDGERFVMNFINKKLKNYNQIIIFDVGANIGEYTQELLSVFKEKALIYSFEPQKRTYKILSTQFSNSFQVKALNLGFSNHEGEQKLFSNNSYTGLSSLYNRRLDHFSIQLDNSEMIKLETIDNFCIKNNINHINFLKLDIEGHELRALEGCANLMEQKHIDFIQFEFGGSNIDSRSFFQDFYYLLIKNYKIYRILKNGILEILKYEESCEMFVTTNFFAISRYLQIK
jgi:FkbM family methyltransferase